MDKRLAEDIEAVEPAKVKQTKAKSEAFLGISTSELAGLTVEEIVGNKQAVTMVMHYYTQLTEENNSLKNDINTAQTYISEYQLKKSDVSTGSALQFIATIFIGFSINLLTTNESVDSVKHAGWLLFLAGLILGVAGLYFTFREAKK